MKYKYLVVSLIAAAALVVAPVSPASARPFHHGHGGDGLLFGLFAGVAAVTVAAATLATAPVRVLADASGPPVSYPGYYGYGAPTYYAAPAPVYAYPPYGYSAYPYPRRAVVYGYPQPVYGYPAPAYAVR